MQGFKDAKRPDEMGQSLFQLSLRAGQLSQLPGSCRDPALIPQFLFKRDVFPMPEVNDQDNVWQIDSIDREGAFVGRCAELCGTYHAMMNFEVRAISPALFDQWLGLRQQVNPASGAPYTAGEALQQLGCGQLCTPEAYTTYPFNTDRTQRSASQPVTSGS